MLVVQDILDHQFKDLDQKALVGLISIIHNHLGLGNYWVVDNLCRDLNPKAEVLVLVSVLRSSYLYRNTLSYWPVLLKRVKDRLDQEKANTSEILQGLI